MSRSFKDLASQVSETWDEDARTVHAAAASYFVTQARLQLTLGEQLATLRTENGFTQTSLAMAAGVAQPEISRIERGVGNPTRATLMKLASALNSRLAFVPAQSNAENR